MAISKPTMNYDKTFCCNNNCPCETCERFLSKQARENAKEKGIPLWFADFDGNKDYCERINEE
jgi:hypothetical protein